MAQGLERLLDHHVAFIGITGSGKTYLANHIHAKTTRTSVFLNPQDEPIQGHRTTEWDAGLLAEHEKINFVPDEDDYAGDVERVRRDLFEFGREIQAQRGRINRWCALWIDEAQDVAPEGLRTSPLHKAIKRGRRHGITVAVLSQTPADVAKGVLKQCQTHVLFRLGRFETDYVKTYNLPVQPGQLRGHQFMIATEESARGPYELRK